MNVEVGGNARHPSILASPRHIRDLATYVYDNCVLGLEVGGFATHYFAHLLDWSMALDTSLLEPIPSDAAFLTISITSRDARDHSPGNTDPEVSLALSAGNLIASRLLPAGSNAERHTVAHSEYWRRQSMNMVRGGQTPWYRRVSPPPQGEMTYECDDLLGSPAAADCSRIEWDQLGPASDTVAVGPGVTFVHSNSCVFAISATIRLTLVWEQIRAALTTLMNVCVRHPYQPPQGGRAYFGAQPKHIGGRRSRRRRGLNGLNALPPHANITIFQQSEAWTNSANEVGTCTWKAVLGGRSVKSCNPK